MSDPRKAPLTPADVRHMTRVMSVPGHVWCTVVHFGWDMPCVLPDGHDGGCMDARDFDEALPPSVHKQLHDAQERIGGLEVDLERTRGLLEAMTDERDTVWTEAQKLTAERAAFQKDIRDLAHDLEQAGHRARAAEGEMRSMKEALGAPEGLWQWLRARFRAKQDEVQRLGEWALWKKDEATLAHLDRDAYRRRLYALWVVATRAREAWDREVAEALPLYTGTLQDVDLSGAVKAMQALADELDGDHG